MTTRDDFDRLATELQNDPDLDVTVERHGLYSNAIRFAYLQQSALNVRLPQARTQDLVRRGIGVYVESEPDAQAAWIAVSDSEDWSELSAEAHEFARGPLPGHDS